MRSLDTNVLVRYLAADHPKQFAAAEGLIEECRNALVRRSLELYREGKANFSDYLIGEISRQAGCRDTVTFDRALKGAPGFTLL
jgi:predicted nucleic-acid-binding protein